VRAIDRHQRHDVVAHCLDELLRVVKARDRATVRAALTLVNALAAAAIGRRDYTVAEPFHACACHLVTLLDDEPPVAKRKAASSIVDALEDDSDSDEEEPPRMETPPRSKSRKRTFSGKGAKKRLAFDEDLEFTHGGKQYRVSAMQRRGGLRQTHVEGLLDTFKAEPNGRGETPTTIRDRLNETLLARQQAQTTSMRLIGMALRIAFGDACVDRNARPTRYAVSVINR